MPRLESQEQGNLSRYSLQLLLQMSADVYHFFDISHWTIPKGGLGGWEAPRGFEICRLDCIKHSLLRLCRITAYLWLRGCVWGGNGASGLHPLRLGSILDQEAMESFKDCRPQAGVGQPPMRPWQQICLHPLITTFLWTFPVAWLEVRTCLTATSVQQSSTSSLPPVWTLPVPETITRLSWYWVFLFSASLHRLPNWWIWFDLITE